MSWRILYPAEVMVTSQLVTEMRVSVIRPPWLQNVNMFPVS